MSNEKVTKIMESTDDVQVRKACLVLLGRRGGDPEKALRVVQASQAQVVDEAAPEPVKVVEPDEVTRLRNAIANGTKAEIVAAAAGVELELSPELRKAELIAESEKWLAANA